LKILIVGCGSIGARHLSNCAMYGKVAGLEKCPKTASFVRKKTGMPVFQDQKQARAWCPDVVVIATPTHLHLSSASPWMGKAGKVLIEKPLAHSTVGLKKFLGLVSKNKTEVYVGCNMRFHPGPAFLSENLKKIGKPLFVRAWFGHYLPLMRKNTNLRSLYAAKRSRGGGVVMDCIHELDYLEALFGKASKLSGVVGKLGNLPLEAEDYAALLLKLTSAGGTTRAAIHLDFLQKVKKRGCEIVGTDGEILWQSIGKNPEALLLRRTLYHQKRKTLVIRKKLRDLNAPFHKMLTLLFCGSKKDRKTKLLLPRQAAGQVILLKKFLQKTAG